MSQATQSCWNHLYANHGLSPEDFQHGAFYVLITASNKSSARLETWFLWDDLQARAAFAAWANEAIREGWRITTSGKVCDIDTEYQL